MEFAASTHFGECRCCLAKGNHRYMSKEYYSNGNAEIYADIFIECFNLYLSSDTRLTSLICHACIKQLKDAQDFRKTVVNVEIDMLKALSSADGSVTVFVNDAVTEDIKEEIKDGVKEEWEFVPYDEEPNDYQPDNELYHSEVSTEDSIETHICGEKELLARFPSKTVQPLPTQADLARLCPDYYNRLQELKGHIIKARTIQKLLSEPTTKIHRNHKRHTRNHKTENRSLNVNAFENKANYNSLVNTETILKTPLTEKMAHVANISTLLANSNVTAFMTKFKNGYPCFYCKKKFEQFDVLREHQLQHPKDDLQKIVLIKYRRGRPDSLVVYVDVKDLKCTVCSERVLNLKELKLHLTKQHKKTYHSDYADRVIPFLISDNYLCQVCNFNFETFGAIARHMNTHYRNFVCEDCGAGFISKQRLKIHTYNLHSTMQRKFPCNICKKTFVSYRRFRLHDDVVHRMSKKFPCHKCSARFSYYYVRQKHLLDVHGEAPVVYKCNVCEKGFKRRYHLSIHIKKEHLNQGDFNCEVCAHSCYSRNELKVHLAKRHGEKIMETTK